MRLVKDRMQKAVKNLRADSCLKQPQNNTSHVSANFALIHETCSEKFGGGDRSRTYVTTDMSREDWDESY